MAVSENGKPIENVKDRPNGHANGSLDHTHTVPAVTIPSRTRKKPRSSWSSWFLNNLARLAVWYAILTIAFQCPSSPQDLTSTSPQVCRPYLAAKSYLQPHVQPYYDVYASPYVEKARPYADLANRRLIRPATKIGRINYDKYAAPQLESAKLYALAQWDKSIVPRLHLAQKQAKEIYQAKLGPHVDKVSGIIAPYYSTAQKTTLDVYQHRLLPAFEYSQPWIQKGYNTSKAFVLDTAYPFGRHAWSNAVIFFDGTLWPMLKGLYIDNVRPQLVMISERIAKYQESRKLQAAVDDIPSTSAPVTTTASSVPTAPASLDDVYAMFDKEDDDSTLTTTSEEPEPTVQKPVRPPPVYATEEQISEDLRNWQKKFAVAADKGSDDLREKVEAIVASLVKSDIEGLGRGLANALDKTTVNEIENVKTKIKSTIASLPDEANAEDIKLAAEEILGAIRASGVEIKQRARNVRDWEQKFEKTLIDRLRAASISTLEVLDGIKDVSLQEVGMRWAWMEGVTYKHWERFHAVRVKLDEWRNEVHIVAMQHPDAEEAIATAQQILEESMAVTEDAAKELIKLKSVAQWKLKERDSTDDFDARSAPAEAITAASSLAAELQGVTSDALASGSSALSEASESVSEILSSVTSSAPANPLEAAASEASDFAQQILDSASAGLGVATEASVDAMQSDASNVAEGLLASASSFVLGTSEGDVESLTSQLAADATDAADEFVESLQSATNILASSTNALAEDVPSSASSLSAQASEVIDDVESSASTVAESASTSVSSVFAGAMAQEVKGSIPILDDVFDDSEAATYSEKLQDIVNEAGDRYADVTRAVSEAIYGTKQGSVEKVTSIAGEQYSSALAAASGIIYGAPQGSAESAASVAADAYTRAVAAASSVVYGAEPAITDSILAQASSIFSEAIKRADENYSAAKAAAASQISGPPRPIHEQISASIESAYSGARAAASSRLDAAALEYSSLSTAASKALPTTNPLDSVAAVASSALQESLSMASLQYSKAKDAVGYTTAPAHQRFLQEARKNYYAAVGLAHEQYTEFVAAASTAVYGEPQPVLSSISSAASVGIYGTPLPAYQSLINEAASQYSAASSVAASNLASFKSSIDSAAAPAQSILEDAERVYSDAVEAASSSLSLASYAASTAVYGEPTGAVESLSSVASENWESLVAKASSQVYGAPKPFYESLASQAGEASAQVTEYANDQFIIIQSFVSELIVGKEPDFTESALSRLSSAYYTGYARVASSASVYANEAFDSASSIASSVSSAASAYFTTPPEVESILESVNEQLGAMVEAASAQLYGTSKGYFEQATSAMGDTYETASSAVSEGIYGTQVGYAEAAQSSFADVAQSAQDAISLAIYGSSTGVVESMTSAAADTFASVSSVVGENAAAITSMAGDLGDEAASLVDTAKAKLSSAVYGPEQGAVESAQSRIAEAVESARSAIESIASQAGAGGAAVVEAISSSVDEAASAISNSVSSATDYVKDEL
ncbi:hypothetical protein PV10_04227 [Exophiala mesophila]|uniref:Uncharacterized protein n=1 Tax=Exophiala mesophila TaxID=212818 RepID=A0A0D1ZE61_EXOME|nr:uncharacterized protein PV10_04227 [Exophiala mesophila]KIV92977.1 hypothetical protein PV10_04227 [Exophiala mesophila]